MADGGVIVKGDKECILAIRQIGEKLSDGRTPFREFFALWSGICLELWNNVRATGGTFRGQYWPGMKPQYTRADGTVVDPYGHTPKVKFKLGTHVEIKWLKSGKVGKRRKIVGDTANVQARIRPAKTRRRLKESDIMMKATGTMARDVFAAPLSVERRRMVVGPKGNVKYAERQDEMRPFVFWQLPRDEALLVKAFEADAQRHVDKFNSGR